jgi:hypothetical protein
MKAVEVHGELARRQDLEASDDMLYVRMRTELSSSAR